MAPEPRKIDDYLWEIPIGYIEGMRAPGRVFASDKLFQKATEDRAIEQVANVATLPGIVGAALAMPDIHWGYGFPIGGVAGTDANGDGVISPGGVGFDIGCGVRLLRSELSFEHEAKGKMRRLVDALDKRIPRGVGGKGLMHLNATDMEKVLLDGMRFPVAKGKGWDSDVELCEDEGALPDAGPDHLSERALERGYSQLGSLGAGNHFLEVQVVREIRDARAAEIMGLFEDQVCVMIHSGSRGIGHQTCTDHLKVIDSLMPAIDYSPPDRQLACVRLDRSEGQSYLGAMNAAGNFARANRQVLADGARRSFAEVFARSASDLGLTLVYDIAHNLAKIEEFDVAGASKRICVHRKGATRAFGPGHPEIPERYRSIGQPVIIPGSMGSSSFVLVGTNESRARSFSSTCHGAGRAMSRTKAKKMMSGEQLRKELEDRGITIASSRSKLLAEEAPYAYKDASEVVETCEGARLSNVVCRLEPVGVVKG